MDQSKRKFSEKLPFELHEINTSDVVGPGKEWIQVGPRKYCQLDLYKEHGLDLYNFEVRPDDVFLIGFPRSGTTLHCEMIWQIANDLNYEEAKKDIIDYRFPHIDTCIFKDMNRYKIAETKVVQDYVKDAADKLTKLSLNDLAEWKGRRFFKAHSPISLLPPHMFEVGAKIIYCARNPKDVIVSIYNSSYFFKRPDWLDIRKLLEAMRNNLIWNCPYFEHVKEAWARRNDDNFLFLFYEDTVKDKRQTMTKIANFLGKKLSNDQLDSLENYLSVESFKNNRSVNSDYLVKLGAADENSSFIGKGQVGGWREYFVGDLEKDVNQWMEENLRDTDLKFPEH